MGKIIKKCINCKKENYHYAKNLCSKCYQIKWREKNPEKDKANAKRWRINHPNDIKIWRKNNPEKHKKIQDRFNNNNPKYYNKYQLQRRVKDINFRIRQDLSDFILKAIKRQYGKKTNNTIKLLGCSIQKCRKYLEKQFQEGMNWNNHSQYGWHIDHIIPCASFDLTKEEEQLKCFHYTNLQPLWWEDNLSKGAKIL